MARLPTFEELGRVNVANTREPASYWDFNPTRQAANRITDAAARSGQGAKALGAGIRQLGGELGQALSARQGANDRLNNALASTSFSSSILNLNADVAKQTDPAILRSEYPAKYQAAMENAASYLPEPEQKMFRAAHGDDLTRGLLHVGERVNRLEGDQQLANTYTNLNHLRDANLKTDDPNAHAKAVDDMGQAIDGLAEKGLITRQQAAQEKDRWTRDFATAWVGAKPPDEQLRYLRAALGEQAGLEGQPGQHPGVRANLFSSGQAAAQGLKVDPAHPDLTKITSARGLTANVNKFAAQSFQGFIRDLEGRGYKIHDLGGYNYRTKRGGTSLSEHAFGNAIDINPSENSFGGSKTNLPPDVSQLAARWGLSWGGDWHGKKDFMHFEWTGGARSPHGQLARGAPVEGSRSFVNSNPGNIKYGQFAAAHGATGRDHNGFAVFPDEQTGAVAQRALWERSGYANTSLDQALRKWSGGGYGAAQLGFNPGETFASLSGEDKDRLLAAQRKQEGWVPGQSGAMAAAMPHIDTRLPSLLPRDKLMEMARRAESDVSRQTHAQTVAANNEKTEVRKLLADDNSSIMTTGQGVPQLSPERVEASLGPEQRARFEQDRINAHEYYGQMNGIEQVPADQMQARVNALAPRPGTPGFASRAYYQGIAQKQVDALLKARLNDPAAAADKFPAVQEAAKNASLDRPWSYTPLVRARMAAQEQLGIPEDFRQPITNAEAKQLFGQIQGAAPQDRATALQGVIETVNGAFAEHAGKAINYMLRAYHGNEELRAQAGIMLQKLGAGQPLGLDDARQFDAAETNAAADAATGKLQGAFPSPHDEDMAKFRSDPANYRRHFDETFGPGASAIVLGIGQ